MGFLAKLFGQPDIELLKVEMTMIGDSFTSVSFKERHLELKRPEYIRFALHYYGSIMFALGNDRASNALLNEMLRLCSNSKYPALSLEINRNMFMPIQGNRAGKIEATLFFVDISTRHITTKIPMGVQAIQLATSVFVLIEQVKLHLDDVEISLLYNKLNSLSSMYSHGLDWSSMQNRGLLPNKAFWGL